uniref:Uncharacterized protein n=1 Tax=Arundo donax TaxID=35708 RepID=A0A0A9E9A0_ARUDO
MMVSPFSERETRDLGDTTLGQKLFDSCSSLLMKELLICSSGAYQTNPKR